MNLSEPLDGLTTAVEAAVLRVLARADTGFSGRRIHALASVGSYDLAFSLAHTDAATGLDTPIDTAKASSEVMRWVRLHPTNIAQKTILRHVVDNPKIQAEAMGLYEKTEVKRSARLRRGERRPRRGGTGALRAQRPTGGVLPGSCHVSA